MCELSQDPRPQTANLSLQGCHYKKVTQGAIQTTGTTDMRVIHEAHSECKLQSQK